MISVNIDNAKCNISLYLKRVEEGETILISRDNKPVAELKPVKKVSTIKPRPFGLCAGEFRVPDDFDEPLPEYIIKEFEGK